MSVCDEDEDEDPLTHLRPPFISKEKCLLLNTFCCACSVSVLETTDLFCFTLSLNKRRDLQKEDSKKNLLLTPSCSCSGKLLWVV